MVFLVIAVALCLLVPWLPVLMYRSLPRRPPDPVSPTELHRLAVEMRRAGEGLPVLAPEDNVITAELLDEPPDPPATIVAARRRPGASLPQSQRPGDPLPRLSLGSYRWLNLLIAPVIIVTFLALGVGWALLFQYLGELRARSLPGGVFLFTPVYGLVCAVPAIFLGIFTALPTLMVPIRLFLGPRRFMEYLFWDEGRLGPRRTERLLRRFSVLALLLGVVTAVWVGLALNWYTRFDEDGIAVKGLFALREETHPYAEVEQVVAGSRRVNGD